MSAIWYMRCKIQRLKEGSEDGIATYVWDTVPGLTDLQCKLDTTVTIIKDATFSTEGGRSPDRIGVIGVIGDPDIRSGDRIVITKGDTGTFEPISPPDKVYKKGGVHHLEIYVREVSSSLSAVDPE